MKLPAFQFYPADWRKDPGIQSLSRHDRSVWFDMLCFMHESSERGVLLLAGKPMPEDAMASILNLDKQTLTTTLTTLLTYGVARRRESDGAIYSKRMVEDERIIQLRRNAGKMGGNPVLVKQNPTTRVKQNPTTRVKQNPTPSSSSPSSISPSGCEEDRSNRKRYATHAEVLAYAQSQPMPISEECCDAFFDRMEEIGWTDDKGLALADWRARFRRYATNWSLNASRPNGRRTA